MLLPSVAGAVSRATSALGLNSEDVNLGILGTSSMKFSTEDL